MRQTSIGDAIWRGAAIIFCVVAIVGTLNGCTNLEAGLNASGRAAGRGISEYCQAPEAARAQVRASFNAGLNETAPGASVKVTCPTD